MPTAANPPPPSIPQQKPRSFFDQHSRYRTQAKIYATLTELVGWLLIWSFGFIVIGALVLYAGFLSRLLPHQVSAIYAYVMDPVGGLVGISVASILFTTGLWWFARRIFNADTSAGLIWRMRARLPEPAVMEEEHLVSSVEEMALATDTRAPAVMVCDGPWLNAAVIGDCPEGAGIMISRELLNSLDPDEKQGVLAHLMAFVVNGDLHLTGAMLRVCYMTGIALTLLDLPFSPEARRTIRLLWRYARQNGQESTPAHGDEIGAALSRALQPDGLDSLVIIVRKMIGEETDLRSILSIVLLLPLLPFLVLRIAAGVLNGLGSICVLSPLLSLVLRTRRMLADTTAAKLTNRPDNLGRALIHLEDAPHRPTEAGWSEMNFILGRHSATARVFDGLRARIAEAVATANNFNHRLRSTAPATASQPATESPVTSTASHNFVFGFHPPLGLRIVELNRQGANIAWSPERDFSSWLIAGVLAAVVGVILLILFA